MLLAQLRINQALGQCSFKESFHHLLMKLLRLLLSLR